MARSVSYPRGCHVVCFRDTRHIVDDFQWEGFVESIKTTARSKWPSLISCKNWLGDEDRAVLQNRFCWIGISEYCGLTAIWLKSKCEDYRSNAANLSDNWCGLISKPFTNLFEEYRLVCRASNGEALYELIS